MQQDLRKIWKPKKLEREIRIRMSTPALDQDDPGFSLLTTTTPESSLSRIRKLMRDIKSEIRDLKDYSKFAEANRCSIRESCAKKVEKDEKIRGG